MLSIFGLIFDLLILVALVVTIRQAMRLNRDFAGLQSDRKAFEGLIAALNVAASRAESAIKGLRETTIESGDALQDKINSARALTHELEIMIQAGDSLANRLGSAAQQTRQPAAALPPSPPAATPLSRAEKDLLEALKARQSQG